jgi:stage II sporulation protein GA (sporulation sigma-E factor processing peptidase)
LQVYLDVVLILNFLVDFLLLLGTNRLTGYPPGAKRAALAAALGSAYAAVCIMPEFRFLGNMLWRTVFLALMAMVAFGFHSSSLQRGAVFVLLSMALGGIASGIGMADFFALIVCGLMLLLLCGVGFGGQLGGKSYVPVELNWQGRSLKILALKDTGNTLRDPLTGEQVLVCGADVGEELLGIGREFLLDPSNTALSGLIPGIRLIPYRAIGQPSGLLMAVRMKQVKIGERIMNPLVAFAPHEIAEGKNYRMLTGGMV